MTGPARFRFDPRRCLGCEACVLACRMANRPAQSRPWRRVVTANPRRLPDRPVYHLSLACHHCLHPACLANCPAGAYRRDPATGAVEHLPERCMGCRYCTWACPYGAPRFDPVRGTAEKCGFCRERQAQGQEPACVAQCPAGALELEPRDGGPAAALPAGFPATRLEPGLRILPVGRSAPAQAGTLPPGRLQAWRQALLEVPGPRVTAREEWPLVGFTALLPVLAGLLGALAGRGGALPLPSSWRLLFVWLGVVAGSMSLWHLGRPARAWRAVAGLRTSWLSREAVLAPVFLVLGALALAGYPGDPVRVAAAAAAGFAALVAVDRVYRVAARVGPLNLHSAQALLTGIYLAGLFAGSWPVALAAGLVKAGLYLGRRGHFRRAGQPSRPLLAGARMVLGFLLPLLLRGGAWAVAAAALGDLLDRWEFYGDLRFPAPEGWQDPGREA